MAVWGVKELGHVVGSLRSSVDGRELEVRRERAKFVGQRPELSAVSCLGTDRTSMSLRILTSNFLAFYIVLKVYLSR